MSNDDDHTRGERLSFSQNFLWENENENENENVSSFSPVHARGVKNRRVLDECLLVRSVPWGSIQVGATIRFNSIHHECTRGVGLVSFRFVCSIDKNEREREREREGWMDKKRRSVRFSDGSDGDRW